MKRKIKKLIIMISIFLIVFLIYIKTNSNKLNYISLGDSLAAGQGPYKEIGYGYSDYVSNYLKENKLLNKYTKDFAKSGYRTTDLINDIDNNKKIIINNKEEGIKTILRNADLVTLSIGANDIFYKLDITNINTDLNNTDEIYKYIDEMTQDLETLIIKIQRYFKNNLIMIGYYNPIIDSKYSRELEPVFNYLKEKTTKLAHKYNFIYIDIYEIFKEHPEYLPNPNDIHPSNKGYEVIASQIIDVIEEKIIR